MSMDTVLVACDLDNTLIHSKKFRQPDDCCVEIIDGQERGFMSPKTVELLRYVMGNTVFVPITTRAKAQYERICWPSDCQPRYALINNGATLLVNQQESESWTEESLRCVSPYATHLQELRDKLSCCGRFIRCSVVDGMFLYACCEQGVDASIYVAEYQAITPMNVVASGRKIYFFPPHIDKSTAIERFKRLRSIDFTVGAGDSVIDIPLLQTVDVAIVPDNRFANHLLGNRVLVCDEKQLFSEFVLEKIVEILS